MTLKFLGEVQNHKVAPLQKYVRDFDFDDFAIKGFKAGFFGARGQYRVLWLGMAGEVHNLFKVASTIDLDLAEMGFEREKKTFKAHITLARIKSFDKNDPWNELVNDISGIAWPFFQVRELVLWKSILKLEGPVYEAISRSRPK